jgi:hypothetical protein
MATVTYAVNLPSGKTLTSGSVPVDGTTYSSGNTVTVLGNTNAYGYTAMTLTGWNFGGWTFDPTYTLVYSAGATFTITTSVTLYAVWFVQGAHSYTNPYSQPAVPYGVTSVDVGAAVSPPSGGFPVSIATRNYMVDTSFEPYRREAFRHKSIQPQRQSLHFTNIPDDGTISTEGLWRREARDWSLGTGQIYYDRKKSDDARFYRSKGIDPWTQWEAHLLSDVTQRYSTTNNVKAIKVGQYIYILDGNTITFRSSWTGSATTVTGLPSSITILDFCTDGYNIYILHTKGVSVAIAGTAAVPATVATSTATTTMGAKFVDQTASTGVAFTAANASIPLSGIIYFGGDRLMMALNNVSTWNSASGSTVVGANLFDLSNHLGGTVLAHGSSGSPTHGQEWLYTHPNALWKWTAITTGSSQIYFAGHNVNLNGSTATDCSPGTIFRSTLPAQTTSGVLPTLDYPVSALPMVNGEYPTAIKNYLNYIFIGTNKGIRMCETLNALDPVGNTGDLKSGPLTPNITQIPSLPVTAIVGNDRYVYWAWNNYDNESTGIGRLDLTTFIDNLSPAYASDLMIDGSVATDGTGGITWLDWDPFTDTPLMSLNNATLDSGGLSATYTGNDYTNITSTPLTTAVSGALSTTPSNLVVASTSNFSLQGGQFTLNHLSTFTSSTVTYTGISGSSLTGCTIATGTQAVSSGDKLLGAYNIFNFTGYHNFAQNNKIITTNASDSTFNFPSPGVPVRFVNNLVNTTKFYVSTNTLAVLNATTARGITATITGATGYVFSGVTTDAYGTPISTVPDGEIYSGIITYGIPDNKNAVSIDVGINNVQDTLLSSGVDFMISTDNADPLDISTYYGTATKATLPFTQQFGEQYEITTTLTAAQNASTLNRTSPKLNRWTLKALPGIPSGVMISVVLLMFEPVEMDGSTIYLDPYDEYAFLEGLRQSQRIVTYVEGPYTANVTVDMIDWLPERRRRTEQGGYHGDMVVYLKTITG